MRIATLALVTVSLAAGLSAQSGKQFVRPPPGQTPPYSLAITAGNVIYVAGQFPTDAKGAVVPGDIAVQTKQVFDNLRGILTQAGSSLDNAVSAAVMLQNASDFPALDQVYRQQFKGDPPARTTIIGRMVRPGALVEIQVTAVPNGVQRKAILPAGWMKPTSPYSYAIQAGDTLYLSGLVSRNGKDNTQVQGDIAVQMKTIMDNAGEILQAAGMSYGDLVTGRVALRDMAKFPAMNNAYRTYWEKDRPARVSAQVVAAGNLRRGDHLHRNQRVVSARGDHPGPSRRDAGQASANFSPAIKVGDRLFISGGTDRRPRTPAT